MSKRLTLNSYPSVEELEQRYRTARTATERSLYSILWPLVQDKLSEEVAVVTGIEAEETPVAQVN